MTEVIECLLTSFLHSYTFLTMQKLLSVAVLVSMLSITAVSAAELSGSTSGTAAVTTAAPVVVPNMTPDLTAAPNPAAVTTAVSASMGSSLGEYKTVACTTNPAFSTNSCDQCFV